MGELRNPTPPAPLPVNGWELGLHVEEMEVPKLDVGLLGGQAITPANLALMGAGGEERG